MDAIATASTRPLYAKQNQAYAVELLVPPTPPTDETSSAICKVHYFLTVMHLHIFISMRVFTLLHLHFAYMCYGTTMVCSYCMNALNCNQSHLWHRNLRSNVSSIYCTDWWFNRMLSYQSVHADTDYNRFVSNFRWTTTLWSYKCSSNNGTKCTTTANRERVNYDK